MPKWSLLECSAKPAKRAYVDLSASQTREICQYKQDHPKASQEEISIHFTGVWGVSIGRSTISDVLRAKDKWLAVEAGSESVFRIRSAVHENLEKALFMWISDINAHGGSLWWNNYQLKCLGKI